ncbi:hypothetical protein [Rouxiella sp. WC2420]|uniref:hypothetical protein n=1 Tax=Rouxiella sp. WC2420 TaxID=3234145 RepID=UPI0035104CB8
MVDKAEPLCPPKVIIAPLSTSSGSIFSFFGAEIVSIAAAESRNPEEQIAKATKLVVYRIALFYILSISLRQSRARSLSM